MKYTFNFTINKKSEDFIKKINYVIGAIKNDIETSSSSWKIRHELLRIESFEDLIKRTVRKQIETSGQWSDGSFKGNTPSIVHGNLPVVAENKDFIPYKKNDK